MPRETKLIGWLDPDISDRAQAVSPAKPLPVVTTGISGGADYAAYKTQALTINIEYAANGEMLYKGYHYNFNVADSAQGWTIEKYEYNTAGKLTKVLTYSHYLATWNGRATYF